MSGISKRMGRPLPTPRGDAVVARLRGAKGWSRKQAADALGRGVPRISACETGKADIPAPVRKLAAMPLGESDA
jgi:transcriptional regulator with XRE-family HTH domain